MTRHILIKLSKIKYKEKILKAARKKKQITYKGIPDRKSVVQGKSVDLGGRRIIKKKGKKGTEKIFEVITVENFPNKGKEIVKSRKHRESHTGYIQGETCQDTH